jgi:hypothetical protein
MLEAVAGGSGWESTVFVPVDGAAVEAAVLFSDQAQHPLVLVDIAVLQHGSESDPSWLFTADHQWSAVDGERPHSVGEVLDALRTMAKKRESSP